MSLKMGYVGSKTRSLGQTLGQPCVHSKGHILSLICLKLGQNFCHNEISDEFENGVRSFQKLGQILEKPFVRSKGHIFGSIIMELGQNVCLDEISVKSENGSCRIKN